MEPLRLCSPPSALGSAKAWIDATHAFNAKGIGAKLGDAGLQVSLPSVPGLNSRGNLPLSSRPGAGLVAPTLSTSTRSSPARSRSPGPAACGPPFLRRRVTPGQAPSPRSPRGGSPRLQRLRRRNPVPVPGFELPRDTGTHPQPPCPDSGLPATGGRDHGGPKLGEAPGRAPGDRVKGAPEWNCWILRRHLLSFGRHGQEVSKGLHPLTTYQQYLRIQWLQDQVLIEDLLCSWERAGRRTH
nr:skin secretory protein xP2-like [Chlorocebus sabaeus]